MHYPWGQQWQLAGTAVEERFAKLGLRDAETSFDPTRYRLYASNQGRWLSPDPVLGCPLHPENLNRYSYAANNPTNLTDPNGRDLIWPCFPDFELCGEIFYDCFNYGYYFYTQCRDSCKQAYPNNQGTQARCTNGCTIFMGIWAAGCGAVYLGCLATSSLLCF